MLIRNKTAIFQQQYKLENGLFVNQYDIVFQNGFLANKSLTPCDGQVTEDLITIDIISKAMAQRWGMIPRSEFKIKGKTR